VSELSGASAVKYWRSLVAGSIPDDVIGNFLLT